MGNIFFLLLIAGFTVTKIIYPWLLALQIKSCIRVDGTVVDINSGTAVDHRWKLTTTWSELKRVSSVYWQYWKS